MPADDSARRSIQHLLRQIVRHLDEGERLGNPRRTDDQIVLPIVKEEAANDSPSVRALIEAWLD